MNLAIVACPLPLHGSASIYSACTLPMQDSGNMVPLRTVAPLEATDKTGGDDNQPSQTTKSFTRTESSITGE